MIFLFICIVLFTISSGATNYYERYGNDFIYLDSTGAIQFDTLTYAPVIWDIGFSLTRESHGDCTEGKN